MFPTSQSSLQDKARCRPYKLISRRSSLLFRAPLTTIIQFDAEEPREKPLPKHYASLASQTCSRPRTRKSLDEFSSSLPQKYPCMSVDTPPAYSALDTSNTSPNIPGFKSKSTPHLNHTPLQSPYSCRMSAQVYSESEDDRGEEDEGFVRMAWLGPAKNPSPMLGLRNRILGIGTSARHRERPKTICTTPGRGGAGETETEIDEPVRSTSCIL